MNVDLVTIGNELLLGLTIDTNGAEQLLAGTRVVDSSLTLDGEAVEPEQTYRVTVNSFLAGGGDGFTTLRQGTNAVTGVLDIDAFVDYLGASSPVAPTRGPTASPAHTRKPARASRWPCGFGWTAH